MWIICESGEAIDSEKVATFRESGGLIRADVVGLPYVQIIGKADKVTVSEIIKNIISGAKTMEVQ